MSKGEQSTHSRKKVIDTLDALAYDDAMTNDMQKCTNCGGHIFLTDPEGLSGVYSHLEDTGCDDPTPEEES